MNVDPVQIVFKTKGVLVEKWIIGGSTKLLSKTRAFPKNRQDCDEHENPMNLEFNEEGIFCKFCGIKLRIVPEWVVGESSKSSGSN